MMRTIQLIAGIIILIGMEILRVYFIMPFPGSQRSETIGLAYFIHNNIMYFRIMGLLMIAFPVFSLFPIRQQESEMEHGHFTGGFHVDLLPF